MPVSLDIDVTSAGNWRLEGVTRFYQLRLRQRHKSGQQAARRYTCEWKDRCAVVKKNAALYYRR